MTAGWIVRNDYNFGRKIQSDGLCLLHDPLEGVTAIVVCA